MAGKKSTRTASGDFITGRVIAFLDRYPNEAFKAQELARRLSLTGRDQYQALLDTLHSLASEKLIKREGNKRYSAVREVKEVSGILRVTKQGFGFVQPDDPAAGEVFVSQRSMGTALDGDTVLVSLFAKPVRTKGKETAADRLAEGEVVRIMKRARTTVVGRLTKTRNFFFVRPDDARLPRDIYVPKAFLNGARNGSKVVVKLEPWESEHVNPEGAVIEVLGQAGDPGAELLSVARSFGLETDFPADVLREAAKFPDEVPAEEARMRRDCRSLICFTIDPEDAKDFDDAVSLEELPDGNHHLGVHIADVSHYIRESSALDTEALRRGTSVYLVDGVIPMLPEKLSNGLCSLQPRRDRLTYSVFMTLTPRGALQDYEIVKSIINSKRRFTYEEVQGIITSGSGDFADVIARMHALSRLLTKKRMREGSIDFETAEAKFRLAEDGYPIEIIRKLRLDAHRLVEEFMLMANRTVAKHVAAMVEAGKKAPFIYRVHDKPDQGKLKDLAAFVSHFGHSLDPDSVKPKDLQRLLEEVRGTEEEFVINDVAIRSMAKAVYSEKNIGHFGLAFRYYTHFTSPIRRYPDLMVHRLLDEYARTMSDQRREFLAGRLPDVCLVCSETERKAVEAERESVRIKQIEYMDRHIGDELEGIISGVTNFGLFIEVNDLLIEGLVRVRDMEDDYYIHDEKNYALIGRNTGKRFRLGDRVTVQVVHVDLENREIHFSIVGEAGGRTRRRS